MQQLLIAGTIGKDAVIRKTQGGEPVASFSVVVDNGKDKSGNKRDGTWYEASLWGKRGEALGPYLTKGTRVTITGRPTARVYKDSAYLGVAVSEIELQGGGKSQSGNGYQQGVSGQAGHYESNPGQDFDDTIPF